MSRKLKTERICPIHHMRYCCGRLAPTDAELLRDENKRLWELAESQHLWLAATLEFVSLTQNQKDTIVEVMTEFDAFKKAAKGEGGE